MNPTTVLLVTKILENADRFDWSVQGLGMLRTYLSKEVRLHIWHSDLMVPNVSAIHDHPWDFDSEIVCGNITNYRYMVLVPNAAGELIEEPASPLPIVYRQDFMRTHTRATIRCGTGGGLDKACEFGEPAPVMLIPWRPQIYAAGSSYSQSSTDVHQTVATNGTVTLVTRKFKKDTEHARVFFPIGTEWVSAEPRRATHIEVSCGTHAALKLLSDMRPEQ